MHKRISKIGIIVRGQTHLRPMEYHQDCNPKQTRKQKLLIHPYLNKAGEENKTKRSDYII